MASINLLTSYLSFSIPIPANTRGIPVSSFAPHSPPTGTSPRNSSFSFSTSPSTSYLRNASGAFHGIARQLTAFLPPDYPTQENHEKRQGKTKILLLENINLDAADYLKSQGYEVSIQARSSCFWTAVDVPCVFMSFRRSDMQGTTVQRRNRTSNNLFTNSH